jgi:branched-chain amino acid transport system substrate-binding protein
MRRTAVFLSLVALVASACGVGGPAVPRTMTGPLTVADFEPFSGVDADFGPEEYAGCSAAIRLINRAGGVLGHPVECVNVDTQGDPTAGAAAFRSLVGSKPNLVALLGPSSDEAVATVPLIDRARVPFFISAGQPAFDRTTYQYLWRLTPSDDAAGYAMAIWAHKQGYRRGAALFGSNVSSQANVPTLLKGFKQLGGSMVINLTVATNQPSYAAEVDALTQAQPDVIFTEVDPTSGAAFLSGLLKRHAPIPIVGSQPTLEPGWFEAVSRSIGAQALASSFVGVQPYAPPQGRPWEIFNDSLVAAGSEVPNPGQWSSDPYTIADYDAVTIAALAMVEAGTTDPAFFNPFIRSVTEGGTNNVVVHSYQEGVTALASRHRIQYVGPSGAITFNRWHNDPGGFSVASYDPSGKTQLIGVVEASAVAKLSG